MSLFTLAHLYVTVRSHVCVLRERPDPSRGGVLRWSLPLEELCLCKAVVAPVMAKTCGDGQPDEYDINQLWFADDPQPLSARHNWQKDVLDQLMDRTAYCGKRHEYNYEPKIYNADKKYRLWIYRRPAMVSKCAFEISR